MLLSNHSTVAQKNALSNLIKILPQISSSAPSKPGSASRPRSAECTLPYRGFAIRFPPTSPTRPEFSASPQTRSFQSLLCVLSRCHSKKIVQFRQAFRGGLSASRARKNSSLFVFCAFFCGYHFRLRPRAALSLCGFTFLTASLFVSPRLRVRSLRFSAFGLLSALGFRISTFPLRSSPRWKLNVECSHALPTASRCVGRVPSPGVPLIRVRPWFARITYHAALLLSTLNLSSPSPLFASIRAIRARPFSPDPCAFVSIRG
jgi:hypothetical protein